MRKKQLDPAAAEAESLAFIKKVRSTQLDKVTSHRKKETKLKQHRFEYVQAASTMKQQAKALEDDLDRFLASKLGDSPVRTVWLELRAGTDSVCSEIVYKVNTLNDLRRQLSRQTRLVNTMEEKESWVGRAEMLGTMYQEIKAAVYADLETAQAEDLSLPEVHCSEELMDFSLSVPEVPG
jgi:hypothetical protein